MDKKEKSLLLGNSILSQINSIAGLPKHGIGVVASKKAVIKKTEMPAIIIETAFLSNTISDVITDEQYLHFEEYRNKIPEAIYKGITNYFKFIEGTQ
ncbi:MAG: N-acetylmuramoyl-L-alanine amidase [Candidatus Ratteibacteria bacterium]